MISIANANQYGNNFTIAPFAKLNDGLVDIFIVLKQSKISMLWQTLKQLLGYNPITQTGVHASNSTILHWQTAALIIKNKEGAALHIDGDPVLLQNELTIRVLPQAFRLIRNNN
jgi:diacylglycerol kinase family enzyme